MTLPIQQGVSAILVNPTDADAITPSIEKANAAGIPVFTIDRGRWWWRDRFPHRFRQCGRWCHGWHFLCEVVGGEGSVVEIEGIAGTSAARDRGQGFNDYMEAECPGVTIVARQTANFNRAEGSLTVESV